MVGLGSTVSALEILAGEKVRAWAFEYVSELFERENLDAIVNPSLAIEVPHLSEEAKLQGESDTALSVQAMKYISIANFLGLPGYSVPVGLMPSVKNPDQRVVDVPVGFHMLGNHWQEHKVT